MNAAAHLPCDPRARALRNATHWARDVSNQFDDACMACLGDLRLIHSPIAPRLEGRTTTGGTVMIRIDGAQIVLARIELTHTATLRRDLPARLLRDTPAPAMPRSHMQPIAAEVNAPPPPKPRR